MSSGSGRSVRAASFALLCCALAGCASRLDLPQPRLPAAGRYTPDDAAALPQATAAAGPLLVPGAAADAPWWTAFGSEALDGWVREALAANPTLEAAQANLAQARHLAAAATGALFPQVTLAATVARGSGGQRSAGAAPDLTRLGLSATQALDVSGALARRIEQAQAQVDLGAQQWAAARLQVAGSVVLQALALAAAREQIAAVDAILALDERNLELVQVAADAGRSARLDVLAARSQLAADRALLPPLRQQAEAARHALHLLAGRDSSSAAAPEFSLDGLAMPASIPLALPSQLARRRPDILAAEALVAAAAAAAGIAQAQLYPQVSLSAAWTSAAPRAGGLFAAGTSTSSLAADLLAPVFNGGALRAARDAAIQAYAAQLAAYRQAVLQAFTQVADALTALRQDAELLQAQANALEAAQATLALTRDSYQAGQASLLQLLDAQRTDQQARLGHARARAQRFTDAAQLFIALGGTPAPAPP